MRGFCLAACILVAAQAVPHVAGAERITDLACMELQIEGDGTYNPEIVLSNGCGDVVFWRLCVNYRARLEREYFQGSLQPGETTRIVIYPAEGEEFYAGGWAQIGSDAVREPEC